MRSSERWVLSQARWIGDGQAYHFRVNERGRVETWQLADQPLVTDEPVVDMPEAWVSPGGLDLQINGGLGLAFNQLQVSDVPRLQKLRQWLYQQGIDGFFPTLITTSQAQTQQSLAILAELRPAPGQALPLGVHLEGPCLNPFKRGVHPLAHLKPLNVEQLQRLLGDYGSVVKLITLAPELDPSGQAIAYLRKQGIRVSLGHSTATVAQTDLAIAAGADLVTHLFNALPPLHHRQPNITAMALTDDRLWCGLILDGLHVDPLLVKLALRAKPHQIIAVSDALAPLGLPDGTYPWAGEAEARHVTVEAGTARLEDGTLAGTAQPLLQAVTSLLKWQLTDLPTAIALATLHPRRWWRLDRPSEPDDVRPVTGDLLVWHQAQPHDLGKKPVQN